MATKHVSRLETLWALSNVCSKTAMAPRSLALGDSKPFAPGFLSCLCSRCTVARSTLPPWFTKLGPTKRTRVPTRLPPSSHIEPCQVGDWIVGVRSTFIWKRDHPTRLDCQGKLLDALKQPAHQMKSATLSHGYAVLPFQKFWGEIAACTRARVDDNQLWALEYTT